MTAAEREDYIRNRHSYIAQYMAIPVKLSLFAKIRKFFR